MTQAGVGEPSGVFQRYARVLRRPHVPTLLLVGVFGRLPHSAAAILLTLHVRNGLQMDFASAGLVTAMLDWCSDRFAVAWPDRGYQGCSSRGFAVDRG